MNAFKITHRNEVRICVDFPYHAVFVTKLKLIPDTRWSQTLKVWHIPYTKEAFAQLKELFPDVEVIQSPLNPPKEDFKKEIEKQILPDKQEKVIVHNFTEPKEILPSGVRGQNISIEITEKQIIIKLPKNETDIQFIRTFKYVRWDNGHFKWVVPNYGKNLELIKNYFNTRITRIETRIPEQSKAIPRFAPTIIVTDLPKIDSESLQEIERFSQWMEQKRYSESTVKTYIMAITVFLRFIKPKTSAEATNEDMQRFVYQYMIPRKLSFSYQNQAVNAARLFFKTIKGSVLITEQL